MRFEQRLQAIVSPTFIEQRQCAALKIQHPFDLIDELLEELLQIGGLRHQQHDFRQHPITRRLNASSLRRGHSWFSA